MDRKHRIFYGKIMVKYTKMIGEMKIMIKFIEKIKKMCYHLSASREKERKIKKEKREDDVMNAVTLSNYIIEKFRSHGAPITNLKLQKVL